jgi:23S rRNA-/tRNA-specific pseudouridylate synthase
LNLRKKEIFVRRAQEDVIEGRADTRIYPFDFIMRRKRQLCDGYLGLTYAKPNVPLPVIYEDDHMAIVNKPSDMICHSHSKGGFNNNSVLR